MQQGILSVCPWQARGLSAAACKAAPLRFFSESSVPFDFAGAGDSSACSPCQACPENIYTHYNPVC